MTIVDPIHFAKLEALGNDFVLIDARSLELSLDPGRISRLADRQRGIGFDQLLILRPADRENDLCRVEIFNRDASPAEQCGNGMRAIAHWLHGNGELDDHGSLSTAAGPVELNWQDAEHITVSLAEPDFSPAAWAGQVNQNSWIETIDGRPCRLHGLSMGNPHLVLEWPHRPSSSEALAAGQHFQGDPRLQHGANIGLAHIAGPGQVDLLVYERGAGLTLACGSGACAAAAALLAAGQLAGPVTVRQPGGELVIDWPGAGHPVTMTGPAQHVFDGVVPSNCLAP